MMFCKGTISKDSRRKLTSFNALVSACLLIELYAKVPSEYTPFFVTVPRAQKKKTNALQVPPPR